MFRTDRYAIDGMVKQLGRGHAMPLFSFLSWLAYRTMNFFMCFLSGIHQIINVAELTRACGQSRTTVTHVSLLARTFLCSFARAGLDFIFLSKPYAHFSLSWISVERGNWIGCALTMQRVWNSSLHLKIRRCVKTAQSLFYIHIPTAYIIALYIY